jgi:hypothetical protein
MNFVDWLPIIGAVLTASGLFWFVVICVKHIEYDGGAK